MSDRVLLFASDPGRLYKVFDVPEELRNLSPFEVRSKDAYSDLFRIIWKELETLEENK